MKVLSSAVTCLLVSHMKPYLRDALESVLAQTRLDVQILVVDSGQWIGWADRDDKAADEMAMVYEDYHRHPLVEWVTTGEGPNLAASKCPVAWATNEAIRAGLVRGRYVSTFYDDDLWYPNFVHRMAGYLDEHPNWQAVWCSQDRIRLNADGSTDHLGVIVADGPKSSGWDCRVDGAQIMFRRTVLDAIGDPWIPEDPGECRHSDGLFLERLGQVCGTVPNIPEVLLAHRFTPASTYTSS